MSILAIKNRFFRIHLSAKGKELSMKYCGVEIPIPPELSKKYDRIRMEVLKVVSEYHENPKNQPIPPMD